ncbi:ABC transporter substrate-binding protein [Chitinivorax sp. B]|uniref:substrate-binding periplasmic protein n=1 Tax=Chitinivorax sp. B TaxID=2502235 RepID=UPI0020175921|nr:ABC transporter substrate-binding protein [Chitinivorax sp. B]
MKVLVLLWLVMATRVYGVEVAMAFGEKIPPFCFPATNSGIELEVIGEALAYRGHVLKPRYFPLARVPIAFKSKRVDAAMTDLGINLTATGAYYGDPAVTYDNVLITLLHRQIIISKPEDLQGLRVISFQGAIKRYPAWLNAVKRAGNYFEHNDQAVQVRTLMRGHYDVVLSDRNIFKYFMLQLKHEEGDVLPIQEHSFTTIDPKDYRPVFRSREVRDDFNAGLKHLKETGRYQAIYDKYLTE